MTRSTLPALVLVLGLVPVGLSSPAARADQDPPEQGGAAEGPTPEEAKGEGPSDAKAAAKQRSRKEQSDFEDVDVVPEPEPEEPSEPQAEEAEEAPLPPPIVDFYLSARAVGRFAHNAEARGGPATDAALEDNASRLGVYVAKDFRPDWTLLARTEAGLNLVDEFGAIFNPKAAGSGNDGIDLRLGYLGLQSPYGDLTVGKQWSAYWAVAAFTDRFSYSGGLANGSFNSGTDGGASGTGRVDGATVYHLERGSGDLRLQWHRGGGRIPGTEGGTFGGGYGGSLVLGWDSGVSLGIAYNRTGTGELTEELVGVGIDGDDESFISGMTYRREPFYFGVTYSERENHDLDVNGRYSDTSGWELYGRWTLRERYRVVGGVNYLEAVPEPQMPAAAADELIDRIVILGFEVALKDRTFRSSAFGQVMFGKSDQFFASNQGTVVVVGMRFDFEL